MGEGRLGRRSKSEFKPGFVAEKVTTLLTEEATLPPSLPPLKKAFDSVQGIWAFKWGQLSLYERPKDCLKNKGYFDGQSSAIFIQKRKFASVL